MVFGLKVVCFLVSLSPDHVYPSGAFSLYVNLVKPRHLDLVVRPGDGWDGHKRGKLHGVECGVFPRCLEGRCWSLLSGLWRAIALHVKPWCAEGDVPTAANLATLSAMLGGFCKKAIFNPDLYCFSCYM